GPAPISYKWRQNSSDIPGATSSNYTVTASSVGTSTYDCVVTNPNGSTNINTITVHVLAAPAAPYAATVLGDHPLSYYRLDEADNGSGNNGVTAYDYAGGLNASYSNTDLAMPGYDSGFSPQTDPSETSARFG